MPGESATQRGTSEASSPNPEGDETMNELKPHKILGTAWWAGAGQEIRDEMVILAQREGLDAAIAEVEELALPENQYCEKSHPKGDPP